MILWGTYFDKGSLGILILMPQISIKFKCHWNMRVMNIGWQYFLSWNDQFKLWKSAQWSALPFEPIFTCSYQCKTWSSKDTLSLCYYGLISLNHWPPYDKLTSVTHLIITSMKSWHIPGYEHTMESLLIITSSHSRYRRGWWRNEGRHSLK